MQKSYILLLFSFLIASCSQFSNAPISKAWHNTNARFNSLIIARSNMKQAEKDLFDKRIENYSSLMPIFVAIDSSNTDGEISEAASENTDDTLSFSSIFGSAGVATNLQEVIKKTSLIAERHSNSKYLGEAYILLGKARLLKGDYLNAIEIFKYINSTESKEEDKHAALVWLMRAYTEEKDYDTALRVSDVLRTLDLNKENTQDFYLVKAYLHQRREEFAISAAIAEEALKLMPKGDQTARVHFAVGQMFELIGQSAKALPHFQAVAKSRPNYDMEFYARMNALLGTAISQKGNSAIVQENFTKMLGDRKNSDLKDKIYFTMGRLEINKQNYPKAIEYFNASLRNSNESSIQNAYTYLELAELNYNQLSKYGTASKYYDSTLSTLPKTSSDYERIAKRATSLSDFVKYQNILIVEDSLQRLATMNPIVLEKILEKIIEQQETGDKKTAELAQKIISQNSLPIDRLSDKDPEIKRWALYDPILIASNKTDFQQIWGRRILDDNWRREDKEAGSISFKIEHDTEKEAPAKEASKQNIDDEDKIVPEDKIAVQARKMELYEAIPIGSEKLTNSKHKQEEALYQLGKIYKFQFKEPQNATRTFISLLEKFPNTAHEAEALYLLALLAENQTENQYRKTLIEKFPASTYARQLLRGNIQITSDTESKANVVYSQAFNLYVNESYDSAIKLAEDGLITYTGTSIEDKFAMLRIFLFAKTEQKDAYKQALNEFIQGYPSSSLMGRAKELREVIDAGNP